MGKAKCKGGCGRLGYYKTETCRECAMRKCKHCGGNTRETICGYCADKRRYHASADGNIWQVAL